MLSSFCAHSTITSPVRNSWFVLNDDIRACFTRFLFVADTLGGDVFFTELYKFDEEGHAVWESDGGVSSYNPTVYEKQQLTIPSGSSGR